MKIIVLVKHVPDAQFDRHLTGEGYTTDRDESILSELDEYALEAVRLLKARGVPVTYRILGGGSYLEPLAFARHRMGLEDDVEFLGARPAAAVLAQMRWADVLLHPAVSEGFGNAVLEAQLVLHIWPLKSAFSNRYTLSR